MYMVVPFAIMVWEILTNKVAYNPNQNRNQWKKDVQVFLGTK